LRIAPPELTALDKFRAEQAGDLSRPEAVRMLVGDALKGSGHLAPDE
jgi:hypothetical protein